MQCCCLRNAGLLVGLDKSHWSSAAHLDGESLQLRGDSLMWQHTLELNGSVIELGTPSGGAVRHRKIKAQAVFTKWKPL